MPPEEWVRLEELFHAALALPEADRAGYLADACRDDPALLRRVLAMLDEDGRQGNLLDQDLGTVAGRVVDLPPAIRDQRFGPYRIVEHLGEGGMGVVYLGRRDDLGGLAAIKILRDASLSPSRRQRFAAEERTLAQLRHPAIAQLYDADVLPDGTPWFAMEYVEGKPLTTYCRDRRSTLRGRLLLLRAVCEAVQYAHAQAVIHRDIKPSNILVTPDGSVKLLDFGIARQLEQIDDASHTRTGLRMMTPAYASPEQLRGERPGIQSDVYSLGVVLYELIAGVLPFDLAGHSPANAEALVTGHEAPRPTLRGADAPWLRSSARTTRADLDVLCLTAMHRDPDRRYPTVEALIRDVDRFLDEEPLQARPDTLGYRLGKFVRRNRQLVATAVLAMTALATVAVFYTVRLTRARDQAVAEVARTQRIQRFMRNLFQGGDDAVGPADSLRVVTLLDRGLEEARALDGEPAVQAELIQTLGGLYQQLGQLDRADSLLSDALERQRQLAGPTSRAAATSEVALGVLRIDQADFPAADTLIRQGIGHLRGLGREPDPDLADALTALGQNQVESGDYPGAVATLEEAAALQAARPGATAVELAGTLYQLANAHFYAGQYPVSDSLNQRVMAIYRARYGDRHPLIADNLINLGATRFEVGKYAEAEAFYREALSITEAWFGEEHFKTASNLTMLGRSLTYQGKTDLARPLLERALGIQEEVFGPVHPRVASALNDLGGAAYQEDRLADAEAYYTRMIAVYREVYHDHHYLIGIGLANLGDVVSQKKQYARAEALHREALARYRTTLPPDHLNVAIGHIKLGRTLLRQRRFAEAAAESLAGYEMMSRRADPSVSFLRAARRDLIAAYDTLGRRDQAARFRALLDSTGR